MKRMISFILCLATVLLALACPALAEEGEVRFRTLEDFHDTSVAILTGTFHDQLLSEKLERVTIKYYNDVAAQLVALRKGDVDAAAVDLPVAKVSLRDYPDMKIFPELVQYDEYGFVFPKNGPYTDRFSEILQEYMADGTLKAMEEKWFSGDDDITEIDYAKYDPSDRGNGILRLATFAVLYPFSYVGGKDGAVQGFDIELFLMIADRLGMGYEISNMQFAGVIPSLVTGKSDVACGSISITEERKQSVDFSISHYPSGIVLVCHAKDVMADAATADAPKAGFIEGIAQSFEKNFIREDRWKLVLNGLGVTLKITILATRFGTLLGLLFCALLRMKNKLIPKLCKAVATFIKGVPCVVLLMVFYFVVFASTPLSPVTVGIITFSILFGLTVADLLITGIGAIDIGQGEAAAALGFGKMQGFVRVILPQAVRHVMPLYKGEIGNLLRLTSIVGYIAIEDLTKVSDIIRSRTYDAFFPLIATALIYFAMSYILSSLLGLIELRLAPRRTKRLPRGVKECAIPDKAASGSGEHDGEELILIEHLKKAYAGVTPLEDVNASIRRGEVITIIGPSGTGKSTLLRCINRLETPTSGEIHVFGENVCLKHANLSKVRCRMGMVFQSFNLFGHLTVLENVMLAPTVLKKQPKQQAYIHAMQLLNSVGMADKALSYPAELSGGQKQRVAIARTLAMDPEIVLLDEPTSALDPTMVGEVLSVIRRLAGEGYTMMIVTHEMKFAHDVSTRVFYMDEGVIYEDGTPDEVFSHPQRDKTRAFVQRLKVLSLRLEGDALSSVAVLEQIKRFGEKNAMTAAQTDTMYRIFDEIYNINILPRKDDGEPVLLLAEYNEEKAQIQMRFGWKGESYDPIAQGDELSVMLVKHYAKEHRYAYEGGENLLVLNIEVK